MTDPFSDANDSFIDKEALSGRLLLVTVLDKEDRESTRPGSTPGKTYTHFITTTVVLDGPTTDLIGSVPMVLWGYHLFGSGLDGQLRPLLMNHGMILGRLGKRASATKGNNPMDILEPPTEDDKALARRYIADNPPVDPFS